MNHSTSQETLLARLLKRSAASGLADDNETLKARIATFHQNSEKILVQYSTKLVMIDADRDEDSIFAEFAAAIVEILATKSA